MLQSLGGRNCQAIKAVVCALGRLVRERPELLPVAMVQTLRLARSKWWVRFPFLPLPSEEYLTFRIITDYGSSGDRRELCADIVSYLEWCSQFKA
ncbi:MAG: hypothetical protein M1131_05010 [Actinobacteria bacterium]|nr:hypothetical protein [Actinomycetota bacterium]MCL6095266.1 hypothetical protein [Actinomycetota bacterium]